MIRYTLKEEKAPMKNRCIMFHSAELVKSYLPGLAGILFLCVCAILSLPCCATSPSRAEGPEVSDTTSGGRAASPSWWGDLDLDEAVVKLTETLIEQGRLKGQPVLITPHDLYDAETGLSLPLASQLRGKLTTEMKNHGIRVLLEGADEERFMILQGTWQKEGRDLAIDLKVMKLGPYGPEAVASASEKVPLERIDSIALTPDRESWARYLVRRLEQSTSFRDTHQVYMRDFKIRTDTCSPELGPYLAGWLRPALAESRLFVPLDPQRDLRGLSITTLRTRGTRAIRPDLPQNVSKTGLTADLLKADGELRGEAWRHRQKIEVRATVINREGQQITAASADIPADLFPQELLSPRATSGLPPPPLQAPDTGGISKNGLTLELTTTRGEGRPLYQKGEHIRFLIRLNRSAWVYLFNLDPAGNAALLYPVAENGRLAREGQCGALPRPGTPLILPEDGCSYDLVVTAPYGRDRVWAVAAETPLTFSPDLEGDWKKTDILVNRLRSQGLSAKGGYAEAEIEVITAP
jgi:hypothetical protein